MKIIKYIFYTMRPLRWYNSTKIVIVILIFKFASNSDVTAIGKDAKKLLDLNMFSQQR